MDVAHNSLRRDALARLAALSVRQQNDEQKKPANDLQKLGAGLPRPRARSKSYLDGIMHAIKPAPQEHMTIRELEVLLAICSTAPAITQLPAAEKLVAQLLPYLPEAHTQLFIPSPFFNDLKPSPWALLTQQLTNALLTIGIKHTSLKVQIDEGIGSYLQNWAKAAGTLASISWAEEEQDNEDDARDLAAATVSIVGFMEAAANHENYWSAADRLSLIKIIRDGLSEQFLIAVESASSVIRNSVSMDFATRDWRKYLKRYAASGNPVGAMLLQKGFMRMVLACTARMLCDESTVEKGDLLDQYIEGRHLDRAKDQEVTEEMVDYLVDTVAEQMRVIEDGSDYLQLSSAWQQRLAFSVKALSLEAFLHCMVLDEDIADAEVLFGWLEDAIESQIQMADLDLADVVLKSMAIVAKYLPEGASNYARILLRFIVQGTSRPAAVAIAAQSLSHVLRILSQDAIITTLYSLGNILSSQSSAEKTHHALSPPAETNGHYGSLSSDNRPHAASVISLALSGDEETSMVCGNVAHAIVMIAASCRDNKIISLAQTMLLQKIGRINSAVDAKIIQEAAVLATHGKDIELKALCKLLARLHDDAVQGDNKTIFDAIRVAREYLAINLSASSPLFKIFAMHLLERIISKGDVVEAEFKQSAEVAQAAMQIAPLLRPLSLMAARKPLTDIDKGGSELDDIAAMVRECWYNVAVHGITLQSRLGQQYYHELRLMAMNSPPLVDEARAELLESDVELNTILRRGMTTQHVNEQKRNLAAVMTEKEGEIRHLSYQKVVFLNAVFLVESLRAVSGSCAEILHYFVDPSLQHSHMGNCMGALANEVIKKYTQKVALAAQDEFSAPYVSKQLSRIFSGCCHRSSRLQEVARAAADQILNVAPSALCQKSALFSIFELLSLMWSSCLEEDVDEYEWKPTFSSRRGRIMIELSDDYAFRNKTLHHFYNDAKRWVTGALSLAPLDVKGLLQTYLSEYDDTGAYGHISLGRSFALEMGSLIPAYDQRLNAIDRKGESTNINVASDFIAQYTTRQEYRFAGIANQLRREDDNDFNHDDHAHDYLHPHPGTDAVHEAQRAMVELHERAMKRVFIPVPELKDVLRRAAALLCRSKRSQTLLVFYLVNIPFEMFSKESIKLGISLWLGVIHENPRMESRILTEVAIASERAIDRKKGIFSSQFRHPDPFYVKQEFAPSDKIGLLKQAHKAQDTISPHLRLLQFLESHFDAIRLGSSNTQRTFVRLVRRLLRAFSQVNPHPLLREVHFRVVYFACRILRFSTCLTKLTAWMLKDQILSTGLRWFAQPPAWSFGGNRLQMKAEIKVMQDVLGMLQTSKAISLGASPTKKDTQQKHELLETLIAREINRLVVWIEPLALSSQGQSEASIAGFARVAWAEDPSLAIQLVTRYSNEQLQKDVRFLLLNFPEKAIHESSAIDLLLGDSLPTDVSFQLKYLLYWKAVNPMQAVTYFLPAFGNHPFIVQYGMKALASHSVDITFFYVPQIVQSLRYDTLGYVEQYIVETGTFSQLFAHQIIWNIKANAYRDEEATDPDPVKPTLDKVMDSLVASFSGEDKDFYEREFAFFGEVTDISGKLKPYIKKSKPEKKQKIEEELRKIKVEVGVYLPSNPDGVVVGIDRKSGKPLQSHAKAPYMATFRIKKTRSESNEVTSDMIEDAPEKQTLNKTETQDKPANPELTVTAPIEDSADTYEVWQSAIFKVGDDCRQDVLALQMIAAFRGIFNSVGLDVYVFPYRVTATAPGCGVIDVLPNSISRDMLGREAVNGLHDYFLTKYGGEHSVRYQEARSEFIKSMAAYSVISYLLQFKDRHNGNIMIDDQGHILHIDFGFCFDIAPGGVKFERAPFKLTPEMLAVMGGSDPKTSQAYRWFEELTIKAFLCCRQYCSKLCDLVSLMLDSGLPCFKPETMSNFKKRFVLDRNERDAARFMLACIRKSAGNMSTKVYDEFQLLTNGIPY